MTQTSTQPNSPHRQAKAVVNTAKVAINSRNIISTTGQHIVGVAGNHQRIPKGELVASLSTPTAAQASCIKLSNVSPLSRGDDWIKGNRQVAFDPLYNNREYTLYLKLAEDYHVPVHPNYKIKVRLKGSVDTFSAHTWFVPILPRMYQSTDLLLDAEGEKPGISPPRQWFYLYFCRWAPVARNWY